MAEKMEDLNLPQAAVLKIIKEAIPNNINVGKDVKAALAKAASMFILYVTSQSTQCAQAAKRKTVTSQDIYDALDETDFGHFINPLKDSLKEHNENKTQKKAADGKLKTASQETNDDEDMDDDEEADVCENH